MTLCQHVNRWRIDFTSIPRSSHIVTMQRGPAGSLLELSLSLNSDVKDWKKVLGFKQYANNDFEDGKPPICTSSIPNQYL